MQTNKVKVVNRRSKRKLVLRWKDPASGAWRERSAGTERRKEAEKLAAQLEADLHEGRYETPSKITWEDFRLAFETEKLPSLAQKSRGSYKSALNHVDKSINPIKLVEVDANALSKLQATMRANGLREATIARHLRHIRAALSWAHDLGMLTKLPKVQMPKRTRKQRQMRGRPITREEFERMLDSCQSVRPKDYPVWQELLNLLWLSGLRLGEALQLSWESNSPLSVDLAGKYALLRISAEAEKGFRDRELPITPDFADWLRSYPAEDRYGHVLALSNQGYRTDNASKVITSVGKYARVIVNLEQNKYASAHDLRRAYGTRWALKVQPAVLRELMRHETIETTMKFYVGIRSSEIARELERLNGNASDTKNDSMLENR